jgi:hypothetical protein
MQWIIEKRNISFEKETQAAAHPWGGVFFTGCWLKRASEFFRRSNTQQQKRRGGK